MKSTTSQFEPPLPRLLTASEVVQGLGISKRTLAYIVAAGKIPHIRIRRTLRFSVPALEKWIDDQILCGDILPNLPTDAGRCND